MSQRISSHRKTSDHLRKSSPGNARATPARPAPISSCMPVIHSRLVFSTSTTGLQNGLITQGRYSQLVYRAISVFETSRRLYIVTDTIITIT